MEWGFSIPHTLGEYDHGRKKQADLPYTREGTVRSAYFSADPRGPGGLPFIESYDDFDCTFPRSRGQVRTTFRAISYYSLQVGNGKQILF